MAIGQDLLDVPFPALIRTLGLSVSEAQYALDTAGVRLAQVMAGAEYDETTIGDDGQPRTEKKKSLVSFGNQQLSLMELGFTPTFYQFVDTIIEVKISLAMAAQTEHSYSTTTVDGSMHSGFALFYSGGTLKVSTVSARFAAKYQYSAEGSSLMRTKLVPVPTPAVLEERIRGLVAQANNS